MVGGADFFGSSNMKTMDLEERIRLLAGNQQFTGLNDRVRRGSFIQEERAALRIMKIQKDQHNKLNQGIVEDGSLAGTPLIVSKQHSSKYDELARTKVETFMAQ